MKPAYPSRSRCRKSAFLVGYENEPGCSTVVYVAGHAGAGTFWARELLGILPQDWDLCAFLLPGRESRMAEEFVESIGSAALQIAREILDTHPPGRSLVLYGQSLGGLVAFEVCRRLEMLQESQPSVLVVLGAPSPTQVPSILGKEARNPDGVRIPVANPPHPRLAGRRDAGFDSHVAKIVLRDISLFAEYGWGSSRRVRAPIISLVGQEDEYTTPLEAEMWTKCTRSFHFNKIPGGHLPVREAGMLWIPAAQEILLSPGNR